jgi:hypothetical protein
MSEQIQGEQDVHALAELSEASLEEVAGGTYILLMPPIPIEVVIAAVDAANAQ